MSVIMAILVLFTSYRHARRGATQKKVAQYLEVSIYSIKRWWKASKSNIPLQLQTPNSGRPRTL